MDRRKRKRPFPTGLELFLLFVINNEEIDSLYELQRQLGINPGSVSHAIGRLESKNALKRDPEGRQRKRKLTVTPEGHDIFKNNWENSFHEPFEDVQSLIRGTMVAFLMAGTRSPQSGARMLRDKADAIERSARDCEAPILLPGGYLAETREVYAWIKRKIEFRQAQAMALALRDVARDLEKVPEDD